MQERTRPYDFEPPFCDFAELYIWNEVKSHLKIQFARRNGPLFTLENTSIAVVSNSLAVDDTLSASVYWQYSHHPSGICTTGAYAGYLVKPWTGIHSHQIGIVGRPMIANGGQWDSYTALKDLKLMSIDEALRQSLSDLLHEPEQTTYASVLILSLEHLGMPVDVNQWLTNMQ